MLQRIQISRVFFSPRRAGEPRQEEGHVSPEAGETGAGGQGRSGEPGQHELAEQRAVGGGEEQDRHCADTVKSCCDSPMTPPPYKNTHYQSVRSTLFIV